MALRRLTVLATLLFALALPAQAVADGDPASDVLLSSDLYLPFYPAPSKAEAQTLTRLLAEVKRKGYPMKVALIESNGDLGSYPNLFGDPQRYTNLLSQEISFAVKKPHLLVVMPGGFGGQNLGPKVDQALSGIKIDTADRSDGLVNAAIAAVAKLATANGHPTDVPKVAASAGGSSGGGSSSHTSAYIAAGLFLLAGIAATILVGKRRQAKREEAALLSEDAVSETSDDDDRAGARQ